MLEAMQDAVEGWSARWADSPLMAGPLAKGPAAVRKMGPLAKGPAAVRNHEIKIKSGPRLFDGGDGLYGLKK
jgi:hypothetical protein